MNEPAPTSLSYCVECGVTEDVPHADGCRRGYRNTPRLPAVPVRRKVSQRRILKLVHHVRRGRIVACVHCRSIDPNPQAPALCAHCMRPRAAA